MLAISKVIRLRSAVTIPVGCADFSIMIFFPVYPLSSLEEISLGGIVTGFSSNALTRKIL
jgi:hypothetical protein